MTASINQQIEEIQRTVKERRTNLGKKRGRARIFNKDGEYRLELMEDALKSMELIGRNLEEFRQIARAEKDG